MSQWLWPFHTQSRKERAAAAAAGLSLLDKKKAQYFGKRLDNKTMKCNPLNALHLSEDVMEEFTTL